jgi:hypothetical protein
MPVMRSPRALASVSALNDFFITSRSRSTLLDSGVRAIS